MSYWNEDDRPATHDEAMQEFARNVGYEDRHKDYQWILTDYDVWVINPHYRGRPQPHPEDYWEGSNEEYADLFEAERAAKQARLADEAKEQVPDWTDIPF
jgi:hypothetical protein